MGVDYTDTKAPYGLGTWPGWSIPGVSTPPASLVASSRSQKDMLPAEPFAHVQCGSKNVRMVHVCREVFVRVHVSIRGASRDWFHLHTSKNECSTPGK